jgi:hypothetical protein
LHQKYVGIVGKPKWAKITAKDSEKVLSNNDEDLDLLKVYINKKYFLNYCILT